MRSDRETRLAAPIVETATRNEGVDLEPAVRFVRILLEWDERRRTIHALDTPINGVDPDETSSRIYASRALRARVNQGPGA